MNRLRNDARRLYDRTSIAVARTGVGTAFAARLAGATWLDPAGCRHSSLSQRRFPASAWSCTKAVRRTCLYPRGNHDPFSRVTWRGRPCRMGPVRETAMTNRTSTVVAVVLLVLAAFFVARPYI